MLSGGLGRAPGGLNHYVGLRLYEFGGGLTLSCFSCLSFFARHLFAYRLSVGIMELEYTKWNRIWIVRSYRSNHYAFKIRHRVNQISASSTIVKAVSHALGSFAALLAIVWRSVGLVPKVRRRITGFGARGG